MAENDITDEQIAQRLDWDVDEVAVFLEKEGFAQFVDIFKTHKVDGLGLLTADIELLRDVLKLNPRDDRRDLMDAIVRLKERATVAIRNELGEKVSLDDMKKSKPTTNDSNTLSHRQQMAAQMEQNKNSSGLSAIKKEAATLELLDKQAERLAKNGQVFKRPVKTKDLTGNTVHVPGPGSAVKALEDGSGSKQAASPYDKNNMFRDKKTYEAMFEDQKKDEQTRHEATKAYAQDMERYNPPA